MYCASSILYIASTVQGRIIYVLLQSIFLAKGLQIQFLPSEHVHALNRFCARERRERCGIGASFLML